MYEFGIDKSCVNYFPKLAKNSAHGYFVESFPLVEV